MFLLRNLRATGQSSNTQSTERYFNCRVIRERIYASG
nr:unnamed protein product [Callosobruchus analis]